MIFLHNWVQDFNIKVSYQTKIFTSFVSVEQRRALRTQPLIEIKKNLLFSEDDAQDFLGRTLETFYVPIDVENFTGTRGASKVTATSSIADCFFLENLSDRYIMDSDGNYAKVSSIAGSVINLTGSISGTSTLFYTAIKVFTKEVNIKYITDLLLSIDLTLEHIKE